MRLLIASALLGTAGTSLAQTSALPHEPMLAMRFFNTIPDVCFQTARGHPPTTTNAKELLLEPTTDVPPSIKGHYGSITNWFRLTSQPKNVFVGTGDRPNACHIILANTTQTVEVQSEVKRLLGLGGFQTLRENSSPDSDTDMMLAKKAADGYMVISLQAPRITVGDGNGDQGAVHVGLIPTERFEALLKKP